MTATNIAAEFASTQNIPQEAVNMKKLSKVKAGYFEVEKISKTDTHRGYFCYNCAYFMKPNHCAIVTDEGRDMNGNTSGIIAPYGMCFLWVPNREEVH